MKERADLRFSFLFSLYVNACKPSALWVQAPHVGLEELRLGSQNKAGVGGGQGKGWGREAGGRGEGEEGAGTGAGVETSTASPHVLLLREPAQSLAELP